MTPGCKHPGCYGSVYKTGYCNAHYIRNRRGKDMDAPIRRIGDDPERFWEKVDKSDGCWEWKAYKGVDGYGRFMIDGTPQLAHRVSFERVNGEIPPGIEVDHKCWNPGCVNPDHLRLATSGLNKQNLRGARRDSKSGIRGVSPCAGGRRWRAEAMTNGVRVNLGRFDTAEEANAAVTAWRAENMPYSLMDKRKKGVA